MCQLIYYLVPTNHVLLCIYIVDIIINFTMNNTFLKLFFQKRMFITLSIIYLL